MKEGKTIDLIELEFSEEEIEIMHVDTWSSIVDWFMEQPGYVGDYDGSDDFEEVDRSGEHWNRLQGRESEYILKIWDREIYFRSKRALERAVKSWEEKREKEKIEAKGWELEWKREDKRREKWRKVIEAKWKVNILNKWTVGLPESLRGYKHEIVLCVSCGNMLIVGNPDDIPFEEVVNIPRSNYTAEEKAVNKIIKCCDKPDYHYYNPWDTLRGPCMD